MLRNSDRIDRMRIASPCPMTWEGMKGDNHARYCELCSLNVYNISAMTRKDVKTLIANTEGRICGRLYKRADGTVITRDCPVGLRAIRRRVSRVAGAAITAVFSFCLSVMGQSSSQEDKSCPSNSKITIERSQDNSSLVKGLVLDINGAVIPDLTITLINQSTKQKVETRSNKDGLFTFSAVEVGIYDLNVQGEGGFESLAVRQVKVDASQAVTVTLEVLPVSTTVTVGILLFEPQFSTEGNKTVFGPKQITKLPY